MRKIALILCLVLVMSILCGCGGKKTEPAATEAPVEETAETVETEAVETEAEAAETEAEAAEPEAEAAEPEAEAAETEAEAAETAEKKYEGAELTVFNCYDYIDPSVIDLFEEETGAKVQYCNYTTNEEMYTKIEAGAGTYDVIFPSDYMIEKMISEGLLEELSSRPSEDLFIPAMKKIDCDPESKYAVPYMWGTLGVLYNTEKVEEEITSWSTIFDTKYAGDIIMMNSMRDTIGIALKYLGYSLNTHDEAELNEAKDLLIKQKQDKIESGYLLDETKDKMVGGEAAIGIIYSGDAQYSIEKNDKLKYVIPQEGSNVWVDGMCIPKGSKNKELAEEFIAFMCREDVARMNFEYIYYCSPIQAVVDGLDEEEMHMDTISPSQEIIDNCEFFHDVTDCMSLYENVWMEIRLAR